MEAACPYQILLCRLPVVRLVLRRAVMHASAMTRVLHQGGPMPDGNDKEVQSANESPEASYENALWHQISTRSLPLTPSHGQRHHRHRPENGCIAQLLAAASGRRPCVWSNGPWAAVFGHRQLALKVAGDAAHLRMIRKASNVVKDKPCFPYVDETLVTNIAVEHLARMIKA